MGLLFRTALIWLLMLAVPAQSIAAATMVFCGPGHHGGATAGMAQPGEHDAHAHHDRVSHADGHHAASGPSTHEESGAPAAKKCSACASCCSIGAMPSPLLTVPAVALAPTVFSTVVIGVEPFAANGPDRPPRTELV